jgi:hypothetical protein
MDENREDGRLRQLRSKYSLTRSPSLEGAPLKVNRTSSDGAHVDDEQQQRQDAPDEEKEEKELGAVDADVVVHYSAINMQCVVDTALKHHWHVLNDVERASLHCFATLPDDAKAIWSRLHPRKYRMYRRNNLRVPRIDSG